MAMPGDKKFWKILENKDDISSGLWLDGQVDAKILKTWATTPWYNF